MSLVTKCRRHPEYRGYSKPENSCSRCWNIYYGANTLPYGSREEMLLRMIFNESPDAYKHTTAEFRKFPFTKKKTRHARFS